MPQDELPPPTPTKVHIVVAGHEILVEGDVTLPEAATMALALFQQTSGAAARIPIGYGASGVDHSIAAPPEGADDARMGRK